MPGPTRGASCSPTSTPARSSGASSWALPPPPSRRAWSARSRSRASSAPSRATRCPDSPPIRPSARRRSCGARPWRTSPSSSRPASRAAARPTASTRASRRAREPRRASPPRSITGWSTRTCCSGRWTARARSPTRSSQAATSSSKRKTPTSPTPETRAAGPRASAAAAGTGDRARRPRSRSRRPRPPSPRWRCTRVSSRCGPTPSRSRAPSTRRPANSSPPTGSSGSRPAECASG